MSQTRDVYRAVAGGLTLLAVVAQYFQVVQGDSGVALLTATIHFFSFFTILSNVLAAAALLIPLIWPNSTAGRFLARPAVRTAIAGYIIIVGVVYFLLLRDLSQATGARLLFERALHYLTPPLFVLDWLLYVPKPDLPWTVGFASLGFPGVYAVWILLHSAVTGWYPYPFLDVGDLGYPRTLLNIAGLVFAFLALELALVGCGRLMQHRSRIELS
jgi:hypothetical protein